MLNKADRVKRDAATIQRLGGPATLAARLGYKVQRVHNWVTRGIPPYVQLDHPDVFFVDARAGADGNAYSGETA